MASFPVRNSLPHQYRAEAVVSDPGDDRIPGLFPRSYHSTREPEERKGHIEAVSLTPERNSGILDAGSGCVVLENRAHLADSEALLHIRLFAKLAIMPADRAGAGTLRVLENRPFLVRLIEVWNEIQLFVLGHS